MFARVSKFKASADRGETALRGRFPPEIEAMTGFKGAYSLMNAENGDAMLITFWETEEAMRASAEQAKKLRAQVVEEAGGSGPSQVETYEVLSQP